MENELIYSFIFVDDTNKIISITKTNDINFKNINVPSGLSMIEIHFYNPEIVDCYYNRINGKLYEDLHQNSEIEPISYTKTLTEGTRK